MEESPCVEEFLTLPLTVLYLRCDNTLVFLTKLPPIVIVVIWLCVTFEYRPSPFINDVGERDEGHFLQGLLQKEIDLLLCDEKEKAILQTPAMQVTLERLNTTPFMYNLST